MKVRLTILLLSISHLLSATNRYFANAGSDGAAGTIGAPWQTLAKFQSITWAPGDSVFFNRGDVFDGDLGAPENGNSTSRIYIGAYGTGAKPVMNALQALTSWTNLGGNIWEASVNSGLNLNLVFLSGVPITQGRTPNAGSPYYRVSTGGGISYPSDMVGYITSGSLNAGTKNWTGAELVIRSSEYTRDRNFIVSHTDSTLNYNSESSHNSPVGTGFYLQHDVSTLDVQNEWFYNSTAHTIRMFSTTNPSTIGTGVKASIYSTCVNKDPISYIVFDGLKFYGYDSIALRFRTGTNMKIINCDFDQIGVNGITSDTDIRDTVMNCSFTNMYNSAMWMSYGNAAVVTNNYVYGCGLVNGLGQGNNQHGTGILFTNTGDGPIIKYNTVKNVAYCGITFDGRNTIVRRNIVDSFGMVLADGGGIYSCCNKVTIGGIAIGMRIVDSNVVTNGFGKREDWTSSSDSNFPGIYFDDDAGQITTTNNTVVNVTRASIFLHNTDEITVTNNVFFAGKGEFAISTADDNLGGPVRKTVFVNNVMYSLPSKPLIELSSTSADQGSTGTFANNYYMRSSTTNPFTTFGAGSGNYTMATWKSTFNWDDQSIFNQVNDDSVRIEYNNTGTDKYVLLTNTYTDFTNIGYYSYVKVPAYSSLLLYRKTFGALRSARRIKIIP